MKKGERMFMQKVINILRKINEYVDWENENEILTKGVIDSVELLEVITELENEFNIEIDIDEISPENFDSVDSIVAMIERIRSK